MNNPSVPMLSKTPKYVHCLYFLHMCNFENVSASTQHAPKKGHAVFKQNYSRSQTNTLKQPTTPTNIFIIGT